MKNRHNNLNRILDKKYRILKLHPVMIMSPHHSSHKTHGDISGHMEWIIEYYNCALLW